MNKLPVPTGWRILIKVQAAQEQTSGGILLPNSAQDTARVAAQIGQVIQLGEESYSNSAIFKSRWCKINDWIMIGKFAGCRFEVDGEEYRIINDDEVIAVVDDPDTIKYYGG